MMHVFTAADRAASHESYRRRIEARVDRSGGPDACWLWLGATDRHGYGKLQRNGKQGAASRYFLEQALGRDLDRAELALHRCDNPPCVNPAHLYVGDAKQNAADMLARGRLGRRRKAA